MKTLLKAVGIIIFLAVSSSGRADDSQGGRYRLVMAESGGGYSQPYLIDTQTGRVWRQVSDQKLNTVVFTPCIYENINNELSTLPNETAQSLVRQTPASTSQNTTTAVRRPASSLVKVYSLMAAGYGKRCFLLRGMINQRHNTVAARSLGLPICDCKERQVCRLTYAPTLI